MARRLVHTAPTLLQAEVQRSRVEATGGSAERRAGLGGEGGGGQALRCGGVRCVPTCYYEEEAKD